jgi:hypothetical protein
MTRRFYTSSGLWRVKLYVQFFSLYCLNLKWSVGYPSLRTLLPASYWGMDKVGGPESRSVTTGKRISSQLQDGKLIRAVLMPLDCLILNVKSFGRSK